MRCRTRAAKFTKQSRFEFLVVRPDTLFDPACNRLEYRVQKMRRTFVCVNAAVFVAACGVASVLASHARAQEQLLDPGWQLASSDSPNGNGGFFGFASGDEPRAGQRPATAPSQRVPTRFVPQSRVQSQYYVPAQQYRAYRRSAAGLRRGARSLTIADGLDVWRHGRARSLPAPIRAAARPLRRIVREPRSGAAAGGVRAGLWSAT